MKQYFFFLLLLSSSLHSLESIPQLITNWEEIVLFDTFISANNSSRYQLDNSKADLLYSTIQLENLSNDTYYSSNSSEICPSKLSPYNSKPIKVELLLKLSKPKKNYAELEMQSDILFGIHSSFHDIFKEGLLDLKKLNSNFDKLSVDLQIQNLLEHLLNENKVSKEMLSLTESKARFYKHYIYTHNLLHYNLSDSKSVENYMRNIGLNMNFEDQIEFIGYLGGRFSQIYNMKRTEENHSASKGIVDMMTLLTSLKTKTNNGVCRDMAIAQAELYKYLSGKEAYVIAYRTADGGHATVALQDPKNPQKIIKLNYQEISSSINQSGSTSLNQATSIPDLGTEFKIFNSKGAIIQSLPSQLGIALTSMSVHGKDYLPPLIENNSQISSVRMHFKEFLSANLFTGKLSTGEELLGLITSANDTYELGNNKIGSYLNFYVVMSDQDEIVKTESKLIGMNNSIDFTVVPFKKQKEMASINFALQNSLYYFYTKHQNKNFQESAKEDNNMSSDMVFQVEAKLKQEATEKLTLNVAANTEIGLGYKDIRNQAISLETIKPFINYSVIKASAKYMSNDKISLIGSTSAVIREHFGHIQKTAIDLEVAHRNSMKQNFSLSLQTPLQKKSVIGFIPGSDKNIALQYNVTELLHHIDLQGEYKHDLDQPNKLGSINFEIQGHIDLPTKKKKKK